MPGSSTMPSIMPNKTVLGIAPRTDGRTHLRPEAVDGKEIENIDQRLAQPHGQLPFAEDHVLPAQHPAAEAIRDCG